MNTYEIEIKSLLGEKEYADTLRSQLLEKGAHKTSQNNQINHYFINGSFDTLLKSVQHLFLSDQLLVLKNIITQGSKHSVRTREVNSEVKLVIKSSVDDTSSENGIARMEFEENVAISIGELDELLIQSGFEYQAKWSREREEYELDTITVTLDKNAGYGWLTEFERVVGEDEDFDKVQEEIKNLMNDFGLVELDQNRLARMFDYYNDNWEDYYGTNKVFTIE
jgi:predicted adenylyl cyclase CyaB